MSTLSLREEACRWVLRVLFVVYLVALGFVVLWPTHVDDNAAGGFVDALVQRGREQGWLPAWFTYAVLEWVSNVIMFLPFGFLLFLLLPKNLRSLVLLCGFLTTCGIEFVQLLMPERTSSWLDIVANTCGTVFGATTAYLLVGYCKRQKNHTNSKKHTLKLG